MQRNRAKATSGGADVKFCLEDLCIKVCVSGKRFVNVSASAQKRRQVVRWADGVRDGCFDCDANEEVIREIIWEAVRDGDV